MEPIPSRLAAGAVEAVCVTQVEEQLNGLEVNAEDLANQVSIIEKRLQSVIQPRDESEADSVSGGCLQRCVSR